MLKINYLLQKNIQRQNNKRGSNRREIRSNKEKIYPLLK